MTKYELYITGECKHIPTFSERTNGDKESTGLYSQKFYLNLHRYT